MKRVVSTVKNDFDNPNSIVKIAMNAVPRPITGLRPYVSGCRRTVNNNMS